tara:strand:+ start:342 stop:1049 length:708 start_codon:yes stop_codon:yes gene_type:complete
LNNELANVSTIGFKRSFENAMVSVKAAGEGFDTRIQPYIEKANAVNLEPGNLYATGRDLDIALLGTAVMGVQAPNGELAFTRRGDLRIGAQGVLENGSYHPILSEDGNIITIPAGFETRITNEGDIYARNPAEPLEVAEVLIGRLFLRDASEIVFMRRDDTLYSPQPEFRTPNGDFENGPNPPVVVPQALESSNVSPVTAMVKLLDFTRSFESQVRVIKEAKSLDESGTSMLRPR